MIEYQMLSQIDISLTGRYLECFIKFQVSKNLRNLKKHVDKEKYR